MPWFQSSQQLNRIESKLDALTAAINKLSKGQSQMALDISKLQAAVANETTVEQSAIALISGLAKQLQALVAASGNTVDPAALQAIVDQMTSSQTALAAAVVANTTPAPPSS